MPNNMISAIHRIRSQGLIGIPPGGASAQALTEKLLYEDYVQNHCLMDTIRHNHLAHHVLAAYDLGASPELLQTIFDAEQQDQRSRDVLPEEGDRPEKITDENWKAWLGQSPAYVAFLQFFQAKLAALGVSATLDKYIFSDDANANGAMMVLRMGAGAFHPLIQIGYGIEFGLDSVVAQGIAQTAIHHPNGACLVDPKTGLPADPPTSTDDSVSLLGLLRQVYDSDALIPPLPYDPDAFIGERMRRFLADPKQAAELRTTYDRWAFAEDGADVDAKVSECIWQATLLLASTGLRAGHAPRLDFFLMHLLTSAVFLPSFVRVLPDARCKRLLLQMYARVTTLWVMLRGRPRIDVIALMAYNGHPAEGSDKLDGEHALGKALPRAARGNPWLDIVGDALHHPDAHVMKSVRTLYYAAQMYGQCSVGAAPGALDGTGQETHIGTMKMDGSIFVRAAVLVMDTLGWVGRGDKPGDWDRSALGWEDAWKTPEGFRNDIQ